MNARIRIVLIILLVAALSWIIPDGLCLASGASNVYDIALEDGTTASQAAVSMLAEYGDNDGEFISMAYQVIFLRTPSPNEIRHWADRLGAGVPRINIIRQMTRTHEFISNCISYGVDPGTVDADTDRDMYYDARFYLDHLAQSTMDRNASNDEYEIWCGFMAEGERNATDAAHSFVFSSECSDLANTDDLFVDRIYKAMSGHEPDMYDKYVATGLLSNGMKREKLFEMMAGGEEFQSLCNRFRVRQGEYHAERPFNPDRPMLALTFDDGPSQYTALILNCLEKYDQAATFFVVGTNAMNYQETMARADRLGCEIGNHTYEHPDLTSLTPPEISAQISDTDRYVMSATGHNSTLLRPPYGAYDDIVKDIAGKPLVLWNVDTRDWDTRDKDSTVAAILDTVEDGDIVLMHDIYESTAQAVIEAVPILIDRGYQLVTVSEIAEYRGGMHNGGAYFRFRPE